MLHRSFASSALALVAGIVLLCNVPIDVRPVVPATAQGADLGELWEAPKNLADANLRNGPWGAEDAPDPHAVFTFVRPKRRGFNPGVVVTDPLGREWHVKQRGRNDAGAEGPVEVLLSRVLSALGYHQPPVYFLSSFAMVEKPDEHPRSEPGGRFRLDVPSLKAVGHWSWQQNPFVGTKPFNGLLVVLLLFNSTDLKNSNNMLYEVTSNGRTARRYVVRDLGSALGESGRLSPRQNDPALYERAVFITGVRNGFVEFGNKEPHQELFHQRITADDVGWAAHLLDGLSEDQWRDAFQAANYAPQVADRFLRQIRANIARAHEIAGLPQ